MKILLKKSNALRDWFTIVRAEHDGRKWEEQIGPNSFQHMTSERLTPNACIEGSSIEMISLAIAIKARGSASFKRCAVHCEADGVHFYSPKNSTEDAVVSVDDAEDFAEQVLDKLS